MRRIKLRQRGFRPQGEPFTGENVNKVTETKAEVKTKKKATKKTSAVKRLIKAITG